MALRKIVRINEELCDGCGECVPSCAEGAIRIEDGKARLIAENLCDGLGACLGECPQGAITVEEREADGFDEAAVAQHLAESRDPEPQSRFGASPMESARAMPIHDAPAAAPQGCPGSRMMQFERPSETKPADGQADAPRQASELRQWPVQLHLVPPSAPYFQNADVLLAADCTAFAVGDFHTKYLKGRSLAVACPKLDQGQDVYLQKLVSLIDDTQIRSLTVLIMEVPCCGGLAMLAKQAVSMAKRSIPVQLEVVGVQGEVIS